MPIYEYRCAACGHQDSFLESFSAAQSKTCPECKKRRAFKRLVSAAGFQLKGSGWYVTDFRDKDKPKKKGDAKDGDGGGEAKTDQVDKSDKAADSAKESAEKKTDTKADGKSNDGKAGGGGKDSAKEKPAGKKSSAK